MKFKPRMRPSFLFLIVLILLALKLTGVVQISWLWIFSPLILGAALLLVIWVALFIHMNRKRPD